MEEGNILILGASSAMARAAAAAFARRGFGLYLAGREEGELARLGSDLAIRYQVPVSWGVFDADRIEEHPRFLERVLAEMDHLEGVLMAVGFLPDQQRAQEDFTLAEATLRRNFTGVVSILELCAAHMERMERGIIIAISSVAGDRGRQSNYLYGAAKGGLSIYLQGLRNRLHRAGVHVMTVKPGFVDTAMTYGLPGLFLVASPQAVGERIVQAAARHRNVIYVPGFWRWIMLLIRCLPEWLFKRLNL